MLVCSQAEQPKDLDGLGLSTFVLAVTLSACDHQPDVLHREARQYVDREPASEIVRSNLLRVHLKVTVRQPDSGPEVQNKVCDEVEVNTRIKPPAITSSLSAVFLAVKLWWGFVVCGS